MLSRGALRNALCAALLAIAHVNAEGVDDPNVHVLTTENFDAFLRANPYTLVEFYAPWCGHCKQLAPEYAQASTELLADDIALAKVDATEEPDLAKRFDVQGYPTLKVFRDGAPEEYSGPREASGIVSYLRKRRLPPLEELATLEAVEAFTTFSADGDDEDDGAIAPVRILGFLTKSSPKLKIRKALAAAAGKLLDQDIRVGVTTDAAAFKAFGYARAKGNVVALFRAFDDSPVVAAKKNAKSAEALVDWAGRLSLPLLGRLTKANQAKFYQTPKPVARAFLTSKAKKTMQTLRELATKFQGKVTIVLADYEEWPDVADELGLDSTKDAFAIDVMDEGLKRFVFPQGSAKSNKWSTKKLKKFVKAAMDDALEPHVRSEPIPSAAEAKKTAVVHVVGNSFAKVVLNPKRDVLVRFCGGFADTPDPCEEQKEEYEGLAQLVKHVPTLDVATFNARKNDFPTDKFRMHGPPPLFFFVPARDLEEPRAFSEEPTVGNLLRWSQRQAEHKFALPKHEL